MPQTPENYKFGGGTSESLMHPAVIVLMLLAIICILVLPRKYTALPLLWMTLLVPVGQQIYLGGVHLFALRLVICFGLLRVLSSSKGPEGELIFGGVNGIDRAFLFCIVAQAISVILLFHVGQAVVNQISYVLDWAGGYLFFRWALTGEEDVYRSLKYLALLVVLVAVAMTVEHVKMFNVFGLLGSSSTVPAMRDGTVRSSGPFEHAILAGTVGGVIAPLFMLLWSRGKSKILCVAGLISATVMTLTANASTCLLAYASGFFALALWPLRKSMRKVRWGILFGLVGLQLCMKAPIWFLIARIDLTGASSSYHRALLVDQFVHHFWDWWLIGVADSAAWGLDMFDVQNQYVQVGENGGLIAFVFFLVLISRSFGRIGDARKVIDGSKDQEWTLWVLGAALFANVVGFFGVNYFDQSRMLWFLLLASISAVTTQFLASKPALAQEVPTQVGTGIGRPGLAIRVPEFRAPEQAVRRLGIRTPRT